MNRHDALTPEASAGSTAPAMQGSMGGGSAKKGMDHMGGMGSAQGASSGSASGSAAAGMGGGMGDM